MAYEQLLAELESSMLVTVLVPCKRQCNEGGMRRVNMSENPRWYKKLCAAHTSSRGVRRGKHDTKLKRRNILSLLGALASGRTPRSKYVGELERIARGVK
jgi:hypothetical protein